MLAMHTGMMSSAGITTDLAAKNLYCIPSITHGPPSAGTQPSISMSQAGRIVAVLLTVAFTGVLSLFDIGGASQIGLLLFAISRMHLFSPGSLFPVCLLLFYCL